jgi:hypothetical protein
MRKAKTIAGPNGPMDADLLAALDFIGDYDEDPIRGAARKLRVSQRVLIKWIDDGPATIPEPVLYKLAVQSGLPELYNRFWRITNDGIFRRAA